MAETSTQDPTATLLANTDLSPKRINTVFHWISGVFSTIFLLTTEVAQLPYEYARIP